MRVTFEDFLVGLKLDPPVRVKGTAGLHDAGPRGHAARAAASSEAQPGAARAGRDPDDRDRATRRSSPRDPSHRARPARPRLLARHRVLRLHGDAERPRDHALAAVAAGLATLRGRTSFFLGRETFVPSGRSGPPALAQSALHVHGPQRPLAHRTSSASRRTTSSSWARRSRCRPELPASRLRMQAWWRRAVDDGGRGRARPGFWLAVLAHASNHTAAAHRAAGSPGHPWPAPASQPRRRPATPGRGACRTADDGVSRAIAARRRDHEYRPTRAA